MSGNFYNITCQCATIAIWTTNNYIICAIRGFVAITFGILCHYKVYDNDYAYAAFWSYGHANRVIDSTTHDLQKTWFKKEFKLLLEFLKVLFARNTFG